MPEDQGSWSLAAKGVFRESGSISVPTNPQRLHNVLGSLRIFEGRVGEPWTPPPQRWNPLKWHISPHCHSQGSVRSWPRLWSIQWHPLSHISEACSRNCHSVCCQLPLASAWSFFGAMETHSVGTGRAVVTLRDSADDDCQQCPQQRNPRWQKHPSSPLSTGVTNALGPVPPRPCVTLNSRDCHQICTESSSLYRKLVSKQVFAEWKALHLYLAVSFQTVYSTFGSQGNYECG